MKIATVGLWHLGTITSLGLADLGHSVHCFDENKDVIQNFNLNIPVIYEPKVKKLLKKYLNRKLFFHSNFDNLKKFKVIFITYDTKITEDDKSDINLLFNKIKIILKFISKNSTIILSSQIPVGFTNRIEKFEKRFIKKNTKISYFPENLRLGNSLNIFNKPDRIIFGTRDDKSKRILNKVFKKVDCLKFNVCPETAEMSKHVINSFLACSISFINEIGQLSNKFNIPLSSLERCVKSDKRIGFKSYLKPGNAFSGGTLARDLNFLIKLSKKFNTNSRVINSIYKSNKHHSNWIQNFIKKNFKSKSSNILQVGLSYKDNTSTVRRSLPFQIFKNLRKLYNIRFHDKDYILKTKEVVKYKKYYFNLNSTKKFNLLLIFSDKYDFKLLKKNIKKNSIILDANNSNINKKLFKNYNYISIENA